MYAKSKSVSKVRSLILIGILNAILMVLVTILGIAFGLIPVTGLLLPAIIAIPGGIVVMLMVAKAPIRGVFIITGILLGSFMMLVGDMPILTICTIVGGILAEAVFELMGRTKFIAGAISYTILMVGYAVGAYTPMVFMKEAYIDFKTSRGMDPAFYDKLLSMVNLPVFIAALVVTAIAAYAGSLWGRKMLRKHFTKAGIV
ncbi:MptD family putative ECF transporter S component [Paenibacillus sp. MER 180]|uniref:MptD family putative ECF transporter S component n=1 Tax=Paenibacillus sp. MER 180 TaxID=2939570 RepID=UPI00203A5A0E|nr:MptD family putative ECF transporter S component [Paenibacillus sp. MER 180]MCM3293287.1 MptD family putative ECF transporter S component [Paenibacillus sp. MER 180]